MSFWHIASQSLRFYWRTNLAVALGVAAATAVLTGALIIGDSMRHSLRSLTIERLGKIDELLVTEGFFRARLADEIKQTAAFKESYSNAAPAILFPGGTVEFVNEESTRRASRVSVLGITDTFWDFGDATIDAGSIAGDSVIINQALADDLQISRTDVAAGNAKLILRIPKTNQLPADSALSKKKQDDLIESLVDLTVAKIIPNESLGRFGMHPTQSDPLNIYVPIELLQESLSRTVLKHKSDPDQANVLLLTGNGNQPPSDTARKQILDQLSLELSDLGLSLKHVTRKFSDPGSNKAGGEGKSQNRLSNETESETKAETQTEEKAEEKAETIFDYWSLSADRMVLTDEAVESVHRAFPTAKPVFTYLANDIRKSDAVAGVPFSMVASIDFDNDFQLVSASDEQPLKPLKENEIVLNEWAANDIDAAVGDAITVTFFEPETTHGAQIERSVEMKLVGIAKFTEPVSPYVVPRRGPIEPSRFVTRPQLSNDPDLTPEVPGVTDAESIENWDLPFETADRIRSQDDKYWSNHRTTPKAFVSFKFGQQLWHSRFGSVTSFRIPISELDSIDVANSNESNADETISSASDSQRSVAARLLSQNENAAAGAAAGFGLQIVPIKQRGLAASAGSTPFDVLFLALSMFVIGSALILVSLLFRLGFQQRAAEVGLLSATGYSQKQIRKIWLSEMSIVTMIGAILGIMLGIGYAAIMIWGLTTWWVGAISRPFLTLNISPVSLMIGLLSGLLVCIATIAWALRSASRQNVRSLLAGKIETTVKSKGQGAKKSRTWIVVVLFLGAIGLSLMATTMSGEAQAGSFMGAGFLVLTALLMLMYRWLRQSAVGLVNLNLNSLAVMNAKRNPLRSTLTIGLVAVASFLIAAVSAFRLAPTEQGTAGFDWVAQTSQPILEDLSTQAGRDKTLGLDYQMSPNSLVMPLRYKLGEDASCNNLYQSTQPQVLGVTDAFVKLFDSDSATSGMSHFAWAGSDAQTVEEKSNPWRLLNSDSIHKGTESDPIPAVIDKNTANYSLKIYMLGSVLRVDYDSGETVFFRVVGFLSNSIFQGNLIVGEHDFETAFASIGGYQYFLIRDGDSKADPTKTDVGNSNVAKLENRLGDYGFDARSAPQMLTNFMAVQNTYLSTFQTLGALGLLLGTFGLAAVQLRSVLERKQELGLMRAVGFSRGRLGKMVLLENSFLLFSGLAIGIGAALFTTLPHWLIGNASVPWSELAIMFAGIALVGMLASVWASRQIFKLPLPDSLRSN